MRVAAVLLLCLATAACNRTEPGNAPAPAAEAPAGASVEPSPEPNTAPGAELTAEQVAVVPVLSETCNLESIDGVVVQDMEPIAPKARQFSVSGWLVDDVARNVPTGLAVRAYSVSGDGRIWQFPASGGIERSDVQALQGNVPEMLNSGFQAQLDLSGLAPGEYRLRLAYPRGDQLVVCDNGRAVSLQ